MKLLPNPKISPGPNPVPRKLTAHSKTGIKAVEEISPWDCTTKRQCQTVINRNPSAIHAPTFPKPYT